MAAAAVVRCCKLRLAPLHWELCLECHTLFVELVDLAAAAAGAAVEIVAPYLWALTVRKLAAVAVVRPPAGGAAAVAAVDGTRFAVADFERAVIAAAAAVAV